MREIDFKTISYEDLVTHAKSGMLGPHEGMEATLLLRDEKKFWLTEKSFYYRFCRLFNQDNQFHAAVTAYSNIPEHLVYVVYHIKHYNLLNSFLDALDVNNDNRLDDIDRHIIVGRLLSYTEADIAFYLQHNFTEQEFIRWQQCLCK